MCDGFVGNIALKTGEGVAGLLIELLEQAFTRSWYGRFVGLLARPIIGRLLQLMDPSRHNGASLLGLQGVVIKVMATPTSVRCLRPSAKRFAK